MGWLVSPEGLTRHASTFGEREVLRGLAVALEEGAPVAEVERLAARLLAREDVVRLDRPDVVARREDVLRTRSGRVPVGLGEGRYSTAELLAVEARLLTTALAGVGVGSARAAEPEVDGALACRSYLSGEQQRMVRRLCTSGDAVQVVHALAGAGKTTALAAAVQAWQGSNIPVGRDQRWAALLRAAAGEGRGCTAGTQGAAGPVFCGPRRRHSPAVLVPRPCDLQKSM